MRYGQHGKPKCEFCGNYIKNMDEHECKMKKLHALELDLENPEEIEKLHEDMLSYLNQGQLEL